MRNEEKRKFNIPVKTSNTLSSIFMYSHSNCKYPVTVCESLILVNMWILGPPINPLNFEQMEALFAGLFKMSLTSNCISTPNNNLWVGFFDFASVSTDEGKDKENYSPDCSN